MDKYEHCGIRGQIEYIDAPADVVTMLAHVESRIRDIRHVSQKLQFLLLKFTLPAEHGTLIVPKRDDWFTVHERQKVGGANTWHTHQGVVIFSPEQAAAEIPTGITTQENYQSTRQSLGIDPRDGRRETLEALGHAIPAFWSSEISQSGHVLIIPENEIHARKTVPETPNMTPGVLHRLWLDAV